MARQDFPLENSEFLAVALYIATTEHTKGTELHHECWPGGTPYCLVVNWKVFDLCLSWTNTELPRLEQCKHGNMKTLSVADCLS